MESTQPTPGETGETAHSRDNRQPAKEPQSSSSKDAILAELERIEREAFLYYLDDPRRNGGVDSNAAKWVIEQARRVWRNARWALRGARKRFGRP
jgi:hypothetical protein